MNADQKNNKEVEIESVKTVVGTLLTADGIAKKYGIPLAVINEVGNFIPHVKVRGIDSLLYDPREAKGWITQNLVKRIQGEALPPLELRVIVDDPVPMEELPKALSLIPGIRQLDLGLLGEGIYFLCKEKEVVYVGQSVNIPSRVTTHRNEGQKIFNRVYFLRCPEHELDRLEAQFIKTLKPRLNKVTYENRPSCDFPGNRRMPNLPE